MEMQHPSWFTCKIVLAGLAGSLLSMNFVDELCFKQRVIAVASGGLMAHYVSPWISFLLNEHDYQETIGFFVGLFGMSICAAIFKAIKNSDLWLLVKRRLAPGSDSPSQEG